MHPGQHKRLISKTQIYFKLLTGSVCIFTVGFHIWRNWAWEFVYLFIYLFDRDNAH